MDSNHFKLIQALSRLVTACEMEQQWPSEDAKAALLRAVAEGRAVLQEVVQGAVPERQPLDVDLPERVIDQLASEVGFSYLDPCEQEVYDLAQAVKREVLARIPNAWLPPNAAAPAAAEV